jgi:hypothetical protein
LRRRILSPRPAHGSLGSEKTAAKRLRRELIAKPWSSEADEGAGALGKVQPMKIDAAVLGHHPVHVGAGGRHRGAGGEGRDDARPLPTLRGRQQDTTSL